MNVWKLLRKGISVVIAIAITLSLAAPALADAVTLSEGSIGYLAMGDDMSNGIGLADPAVDTYAVKVAKKLYGDNWENSYKIRAGAKYRVEELRYLIDNDYSGDGYTEALKWDGSTWSDFERAKKNGTVREEVASADYITISAGVNNFSTYIVEQMLYYVENGGEVKYSYDIASVLDAYSYDGITGGEAYTELDNIKQIVKNELLAAAGDTMDEAVELVDFVAEVAAYTVMSYVVSFNELINEIYAINPDAQIYVVGIYNAMAGETLSVTVEGQTKTVNIGKFFAALAEMANAYTQILAPRVYDYTYVHPGNPELLIDVMGNSNLSIEDRIPKALKTKLLNATESTAVSMIQEMFAEYGVEKTYDEAADIAYEIFEAETADERLEVIKAQINDLAVDEVLDRFAEELENYANTYGNIEVTAEMIQTLLTNLENADNKTTTAEEFVVDLMTKAMVGQTFAGIEIKTQEDAYAAIELLEKNAGDDPDAMREAAAAMVIAEIGEDNVLGIDEADVVELLELMDKQTSTEAREEVVDGWLNTKAVEYITETVQQYVPNYKNSDAEALLAQMEASETDDDAAIAKAHLLTHFTPVLADKMEEKYAAGGFTLQTFDSFTAFADAINNAADEAAVKTLVRNEIREAAAVAIYEYATKTEADDGSGTTMALWGACACEGEHDPATCSGLSLNMVREMLTTMDSKTAQEDKDAALRQWLITYMCNGVAPEAGSIYEVWFFNPVFEKFQDAYNSYNDAATTAENMCADYHSSVNKAADAFGSYAELKQEAADTIITKYEESYKGAGETAQAYYQDYLKLKEEAVKKVLNGYNEYEQAIQKGLDSCDQLNEVFDGVFSLLCEIAEVETISLNDILAVAKKVKAGGYINEMVDNLIQGDSLAKEDKTVAYLALRYYLADSMMIMPSASGHQTIANQISKAIDGEDTYSTGGYYANKVIEKAIDVYHCANAYRDLSSSESGQATTLINPELYVALGDNITSGSALEDATLAYPQLVADALAISTDDIYGSDYDYLAGATAKDPDAVNNYAINGMRVEELLMLVDDNYNGDEYTADRFGTDYIAGLRESYREDIVNADLITINVGINNLTTYPIVQTLLAYNGEEPYAMDWGRFIGDSRADTLNKGKNAAIELTLALVDNAESRVQKLDDYSAYERCERALNTLVTAVESTVYSYISYVFTLDDAVERIADLNPDGTIALVGFYNPLEGTYFQVNRTVTIGDNTVDLSQYKVNTDKLADMVLNLANRYLANYVGKIASDGTAADEGSRLLNVKINDTELFVTNDETVSKDLSTLTTWKEFTVRGRTIPVKVPEYFLQTGRTAGECLHPNAAGHAYIAEQILSAVDFEIYADVVVENYTKTYGDPDPDFEHLIDDLSSLWGIEVTGIERDEGEEVGFYDLRVVYTAEEGYAEVEEVFGQLEIIKREATITVTVKDGAIINVAYDNVLEADQYLLTADDLTLSGTEGAYEVTADSAYINKNYELTVVVEEEKDEVTIGTIEEVSPVLKLESEVKYAFKFQLNGFDMDDVAEMGLLKFYTKTADKNDSNYETADEITTGYRIVDGKFSVYSNGIPAKNMGDDGWYRIYVKMTDGQIVYSGRYKFSAMIYSQAALTGDYSTELKALCVSLMNYGAAAQVYFNVHTDYTYDALMNEFLNEKAYKQYKDLVTDYADTMINTRIDADTTKHGQFVGSSVFNQGYNASLELLGSITLNIKVPYEASNVTESGVIIWSQGAYESADVLTWENATAVLKADPDGCIDVGYTGVAAKNMGDTIFCCAYVVSNGAYRYTPVFRTSIDYYAKRAIDTSNEEMKTLAEYMVVYGEYAYDYFIIKNGGHEA